MNPQNHTPRIGRMVREIELTLRAQPKAKPGPRIETQPLADAQALLQSGARIKLRRANQAQGAAKVSRALDRITWVATILAGVVALFLLANSLAPAPARNTAQLLALPLSTAHASGAPRADTSVPSASGVFAGREAAAQESAPSF
jgi:hypothetical protein